MRLFLSVPRGAGSTRTASFGYKHCWPTASHAPTEGAQPLKK
jgi:hypothetical protein